MTSTHGRCLCGAVRFSFDPDGITWQGFCHCESCRRNCSAPVTAFLVVRDTAWRWTGETPAVYHSSPGVRRMFCATCGTPMAYAADRHGSETHFYAASLDDPAGFVPQEHVFWSERLDWLRIKDSLPRHARGSQQPAE